MFALRRQLLQLARRASHSWFDDKGSSMEMTTIALVYAASPRGGECPNEPITGDGMIAVARFNSRGAGKCLVFCRQLP